MKYAYEGPRQSVTLTHRFDATAERVFDAWITPETATKWLFTTKTSKTECVFDVRVGGAYTITRQRGDKQYVAVGTYLEIDRPRRLVFTFAMPQFAADADTIIVEIAPDREGCILTLTHEGLRPGYDTSTITGWGKMFVLAAQALRQAATEPPHRLLVS